MKTDHEIWLEEVNAEMEDCIDPFDSEKITLSDGETAEILRFDSGKVTIWKYGYGELAASLWYKKADIDQLINQANAEYNRKKQLKQTNP